MYGAKDAKRLQLFIDDLNLPGAGAEGVQQVNEVSILDISDMKVVRKEKEPNALCIAQRRHTPAVVYGFAGRRHRGSPKG